MKQQISKCQFRDRFRDMGRSEQFSYDALGALYDHLEEFDENMELDVIALCCDFTEYENLEELQKDYPDIKDFDDLRNHTFVIHSSGESFIIQQF